MPWIGKSVLIVRANSASTTERSCSSATIASSDDGQPEARAGADLSHQGSEIIGRHGRSEVEALTRVAACGYYRLELIGRLDAFGHDGHAETMGQLSHRAYDDLTGRV